MFIKLDIMCTRIIRRIQVIRLGRKLRRKRINPLDKRLNPIPLASCPHLIFRRVDGFRNLFIAEAGFFGTHDDVAGETVQGSNVAELVAEMDDVLEFVQEPVVDFGEGVNFLEGVVFVEHGLADGEETLVGGDAERVVEVFKGEGLETFETGVNLTDCLACQMGKKRKGREEEGVTFWRDSSKVRPMAMTSPTDFMLDPISRLTCWNLLRSQRGILVTI